MTSILIDADRTNTACFEDDVKQPKQTSVDRQTEMWRRCRANCEAEIKRMQMEKAPSPLDNVRTEILEACAEFDGGDCGIFRLVVPCGAGKTLSALRYALQAAKRYKKSHIFYIAPYNSILEFTGNIELIAKTNPVKIRGEWDIKASLISSNDDDNFTYRGRFKTKDKDSGYNEALSVGYETSQKIHNALKWIIRRQGYIRDGVCLVVWESNLKDLPQFYEGTAEMLEALSNKDEQLQNAEDVLFGEKESDRSDTNYASARDFNLAIEGYAKQMKMPTKLGKRYVHFLKMMHLRPALRAAVRFAEFIGGNTAKRLRKKHLR